MTGWFLKKGAPGHLSQTIPRHILLSLAVHVAGCAGYSCIYIMEFAAQVQYGHFSLFLFRIARAGIFPRSSLLGAGQLGFWEFGEGGSVG